MKIRQQRGHLKDSLGTEQEVEPTIDALRTAIIASSPFFETLTVDQVRVTPYCQDGRTGQCTYLILIDDYGPWGFADGPLAGR